PAEPRDGHRLRGVDLAVVIEDRADAGLAREAGRAPRRRAVAVEDALLGHRGRARAERVGIRVPAVPDPAADGGDPVAGSRPREERVLPDLELPLERAGFLAVRPDVPGGDEPQVGGVDVDERVLVVAVVIAGVVAPLVDLRE